jgi:hypothetical protein
MDLILGTTAADANQLELRRRVLEGNKAFLALVSQPGRPAERDRFMRFVFSDARQGDDIPALWKTSRRLEALESLGVDHVLGDLRQRLSSAAFEATLAFASAHRVADQMLAAKAC